MIREAEMLLGKKTRYIIHQGDKQLDGSIKATGAGRDRIPRSDAARGQNQQWDGSR